MNKKKIKLSIVIFLFPFLLFSQITPDSLIGTYAGERWFKWEEDTEWTIFADTVYITEINNCWLMALVNNASMGGIYIGGSRPFETSYSFCNGNAENYIHRFHSEDSLSVIYDEISQPPPDDHVSSTRFFSKKISSDILIHTEDIEKNNDRIIIYPNPFTNHINVKIDFQSDSFDECIVKMLDINGNEVMIKYNQNNNQLSINTEVLAVGVYTLQIIQNNSIKSYKVIKI